MAAAGFDRQHCSELQEFGFCAVCCWCNQPTKTNTNNNTRQVIQWHYINTKPISTSFTLHGANQWHGGQQTLIQRLWAQPRHIFHAKDFEAAQSKIDISSIVAAVDYPKIKDADWSIQILS